MIYLDIMSITLLDNIFFVGKHAYTSENLHYTYT